MMCLISTHSHSFVREIITHFARIHAFWHEQYQNIPDSKYPSMHSNVTSAECDLGSPGAVGLSCNVVISSDVYIQSCFVLMRSRMKDTFCRGHRRVKDTIAGVAHRRVGHHARLEQQQRR